jgi:hypothetical protein
MPVMAARVHSMCDCGAGAETDSSPTDWRPYSEQEKVTSACDNGSASSSVKARSHAVPEPVQTQSKPASTRGSASDERVLAQVEKWMAMIREIDRDRSAPPKLRA